MEKERGMPVNGPASRRAINGKTVAGAQRTPRQRAWPRTPKQFDGSVSSHSLARSVNQRDACRTTGWKMSRP
jgi:hypothetical protein